MAKILKFAAKTRTQNLDVEELGGIDYFSTGPISEAWPKQMRIRLLSKKEPEDYFPVGPLRLVSSRFIEICRDFHVNAEFLPVQMLEKDGAESRHAFHCCHLLDHVDCVDFKKSKITYRNKKTKWIDELVRLVIDEDKAVGHPLFRVDVSLFIIAASDAFAQAAQRLRLSGALFLDPSEWSGVSC
jgi:hypothetical protein